MRVLLLHPEDGLERYAGLKRWDLVVDLARAPASTYQDWSRIAGCRVISLFDFAQRETELRHTRELLQAGMGIVVDRVGIDWWDVLSLMLVSELLQILLVRRLARELSAGCELSTTRPNLLAFALCIETQGKLISLEGEMQARFRRFRRYSKVVRQLDRAQIFRVMQDKYDPQHKLRSRVTRRLDDSREPVVLLPSAYVNVSRTAVAYAAELPSQKFLLVCARDSGYLRELPPNVQMTSLHPYFTSSNQSEIDSLGTRWQQAKSKLVSTCEEFALADSVNLMQSIPSKLRWGIAIRNAWEGVFQSQNIVSCLCADDSNPYTRIPLIMAKQRSVPTVACHHGALDFRLAFKAQHADCYLAKNDMERDYVERFCQGSSEKIAIGAPRASSSLTPEQGKVERPWLVFFSEPYETWRSEEVYRELLPELLALAESLRLKLVIKLHPFENVKTHRRHLRRYLGAKSARQVIVLANPLSVDAWRKIQVALTVQSTVALDCTRLGIPIFLCGWLQDSFSGYAQQFSRFGAGRILESVDDLAEIPRILQEYSVDQGLRSRLSVPIKPESLRKLLCDVKSHSDAHNISDSRAIRAGA